MILSVQSCIFCLFLWSIHRHLLLLPNSVVYATYSQLNAFTLLRYMHLDIRPNEQFEFSPEIIPYETCLYYQETRASFLSRDCIKILVLYNQSYRYYWSDCSDNTASIIYTQHISTLRTYTRPINMNRKTNIHLYM